MEFNIQLENNYYKPVETIPGQTGSTGVIDTHSSFRKRIQLNGEMGFLYFKNISKKQSDPTGNSRKIA